MAGSSVSRADVRETLRQCAVLAEVSDAGLNALARASNVRSLAKGELFLREGVAPDYFGVLLSGHVRAVHFSHDGRPITLLSAWPGEAVSLMAMLAGRPIEADVQAAEPTEIAIVPKAALESLLADEPRLARALLTDCTRQLFDVVGVVKSLSVDVVARVANYILQRIPPSERRAHHVAEINLGVTRVELAATLGTVPETLSRAFATLKEENVIAGRGRVVKVLDMAALKQRATGDSPQ
jgi:CRP/FNR family transcriptional regulator